jgi:biopolymer transport protein ExbD
MRASAIVLALLLAACGGPDGTNGGAGPNGAAAARADLPQAGATLTLSAEGAERCSAKWDGVAVTRAQLLDRAGAAIDRAIANVGSVQNVSTDSMPVIRVEAPAEMSFACVDAMIAPVQRAGFLRLILAPANGAEPELAAFPLTDIGPPPPVAIVRIAAGGRMTWNGDAVDAGGLTERARRMGGFGESPAPPGELEIRPAREASFGAVHAAIAAVRQGNVQAALLPPSVEPRPQPPAPAPPPPAPAAPPR